MSDRPSPLPSGDIQFYDNYPSPLDAGNNYTLSVEQDVSSTEQPSPPPSTPTLPQTFTAFQNFMVVAPRFVIAPADVHAVFPPANISGFFGQNLAHVVLNQRVLPWETRDRDLISTECPLVALLLFTADQIIPPAGTVSPSPLANPTLVGTYAVSDVTAPPQGTLGSEITPEPWDDTTCQAIDISTETFQAVMPKAEDLPYLAHARQVDPGDKTTDLAAGNGWYSVVIGNRFPAQAAPVVGTLYIAHLVSIEGFEPYLVDQPAWPSGITTVRLVSLVNWSFTSMPQSGDFAQLMMGLTSNLTASADSLALRLPVTPPAVPPDPASPQGQVLQALQQGYAALEYDTNVGDQTFAWYHGPFVPTRIAPFNGSLPFASSSAASIYDATSGTFDLTYAAGFELGRLLALSNGGFVASQMSSRKSLRKVLNLVRERARGPIAAGQSAGVTAPLAPPFGPRAVSGAFIGWLANELPKTLPMPGMPAVRPPEPALRLATKRPSAAAQIRTLLDRPDVQAIVQKHAAALTEDGPLSDSVDWLARLQLLQPVPFAYLVPDARALPPESIRFFYVDPNYLDALQDGATGIGVHSSADVQIQGIVRGVIRDAVNRRAAGLRAKLTGRATPPADAGSSGPAAGLLLRSAVVSGWPGLEVKAFTGDDGKTGPIPLLRMDRLAPDTLLCLFGSIPAWIELDEPRESLAFGIEDGENGGPDVVNLRYLEAGNGNGNIGATSGQNVPLTADYLDSSTGVLAVNAWQAKLQAQFSATTQWGPAAFAVQMVRAPEQMIFQNTPNKSGSARAPGPEVSHG